MRTRNLLASILLYIFLTLFAVFLVFPILTMVVSSLKDEVEILIEPLGFPEHVKWSNYRTAFIGIRHSLLNSIVVAGLSSVVGVMVVASTGYGLARIRFRGQKIIYVVLVAAYALPATGMVIPLFRTLSAMNLYGELAGVIFPYIALGVPFGTIIMYTFFLDIPIELEEAALIDGANRLRTFLYVIVPVSTPVISTVLILNIISSWNEYLVASLMLPERAQQTLPVALMTFRQQYQTNWGAITAAISMTIAPFLILYSAFQSKVTNALAGLGK